MYKRRRVTQTRLNAAPSMPTTMKNATPTGRLNLERDVNASWASLCGCCEYKIVPGDPAYYVKGSGLIRHQVCEANEDYSDRVASFRSDLLNSRRRRELTRKRAAVRVTAQLLRTPSHSLLREKFLKVIKDAQSEHDIRGTAVGNVIPFRRPSSERT